MTNFCSRCGAPTSLSEPLCASCKLATGDALQTSVPTITIPPVDRSKGFLPLDFPLPVADSLGSLLGQSFKLFCKNYKLIAQIVFTVWLPVNVVVNFLMSLISHDATVDWRVSAFIGELFGSWVAPALVYGLLLSLRGNPAPSTRDCLRWGSRQWGKTLSNRVRAGIYIGVGTLLLIVPGIIMWTRFAFTDEICAVEGDNAPSSVLDRSKDLTQGIRVRLFAAGAIFFCIFVVGIFLLAIPETFLNTWLVAAITDTINEVLLAFFSCVLLIAYLDRRRVEMMASQSAGSMSAKA